MFTGRLEFPILEQVCSGQTQGCRKMDYITSERRVDDDVDDEPHEQQAIHLLRGLVYTMDHAGWLFSMV